MLSYAHSAVTRRYPVEVSGWDSSESFFVVNCELFWNEETGKRVLLARKLRDHAILFVRLLQRGHSERSHPVVYEAQLVGRALNGRNEFQLNILPPKVGERERWLQPKQNGRVSGTLEAGSKHRSCQARAEFLTETKK